MKQLTSFTEYRRLKEDYMDIKDTVAEITRRIEYYKECGDDTNELESQLKELILERRESYDRWKSAIIAE